MHLAPENVQFKQNLRKGIVFAKFKDAEGLLSFYAQIPSKDFPIGVDMVSKKRMYIRTAFHKK